MPAARPNGIRPLYGPFLCPCKQILRFSFAPSGNLPSEDLSRKTLANPGEQRRVGVKADHSAYRLSRAESPNDLKRRDPSGRAANFIPLLV